MVEVLGKILREELQRTGQRLVLLELRGVVTSLSWLGLPGGVALLPCS